MEVLWQRRGRASKAHPASLRRRDALSLPLAYVHALVLRNERQDLQHDVAEKRPHQILASPRVQQRHIQHDDVDAFLLRQHAPLFQYLRIIPPETVDALDAEQVVSLHFTQQLLVLRSVEVLARLLVRVDVFIRDAHLVQRNGLSSLSPY